MAGDSRGRVEADPAPAAPVTVAAVDQTQEGDVRLRAFGVHLRRYVIPYVLLFVLLGGTAYAASKVKSGDSGRRGCRQSDATVANGSSVSHTTKCKPGERALGGGSKWSGTAVTGNQQVAQAFLSSVKNPIKYTVVGRVNRGGSRTLIVEAAWPSDPGLSETDGRGP